MRLALGIVIAFCLCSQATVVVSQQQEASKPSAANQDSPSSVTPTAPQAERTKEPQSAPPAESKPEPNPEPKKKADAAPAGATVNHRAQEKRAPAPDVPAPDDAPRKIVVRQGGIDEPTAQIVTGMPREEANRQRQEAEQLLNSTDQTLNGLAGHTLNDQQQETVSQIHNYMQGAHSALKEGDISRAHTLAVKAGLLADDLAGR